MTARVLSLLERLPAEAPVRRDLTLYSAGAIFLQCQARLLIPPPAPSELIQELAATRDPQRRLELADAIARTAL